MAASINLRRLRDIRLAEEEQRLSQLEAELGDCQRLKSALLRTRERASQARAMVASSVHSGEVEDRIAGLEEIRTADRMVAILAAKIDEAEKRIERKRQDFLAKRIERRQVETIYQSIQAQDAVEANRKSQLALDDWHRAEQARNIRKASPPHLESDIPLTP